jgi:tubulin-specific chaperone C
MTSPEDADPPGSETSLQQKFFRYFQHEVTELQNQIDRLAERPAIAGERADAADHCLAGISRLSSELKDASTYLPPYDQRTYTEAVKALQDKLQDTRATFAPKQKFSFKSARKSPSAVSLSDAAELAAQKRKNISGYLSPNSDTPSSSLSVTPGYLQTPPNERSTANRPVPDSAPPPSSSLTHSTTTAELPNNDKENDDPTSSSHPTSRPALSQTATSISINSTSKAHIILPSTSARSPNTPCTISRLTSCVLDLSSATPSASKNSSTGSPSPLANLTITHVSDSLLSCGTVNGPAHVTDLKNSVLVITCRQLRMHECHDVVVYLHCTSRPIIEDCSGVKFTTLPQTHLDLVQLAQSNITSSEGAPGSLHDSKNMYDQVDDFKWLKSEPSPNWSVLPPSERVPEEVWREVVPGGPGWGVDDILKSVGIGASVR